MVIKCFKSYNLINGMEWNGYLMFYDLEMSQAMIDLKRAKKTLNISTQTGDHYELFIILVKINILDYTIHPNTRTTFYRSILEVAKNTS